MSDQRQRDGYQRYDLMCHYAQLYFDLYGLVWNNISLAQRHFNITMDCVVCGADDIHLRARENAWRRISTIIEKVYASRSNCTIYVNDKYIQVLVLYIIIHFFFGFFQHFGKSKGLIASLSF